MRGLLIYLLRILARAMLWRYRPEIVAVTGSVGKTSSKEAIFAVLEKKFRVRRNQKNYNNEIGVPLAIIGQETGGRSVCHWLKVFVSGILGIVYQRNYPEILVLEMGADKIGDIAYLVSFIRCRVGVVTAVGEIPVHVEFFQDAEQVAREKSNLIKSLTKEDWAVLNFDDERICAMAERTRAKILSFGFSEQATLRASQFEQHLENLRDPLVAFKVDYLGSNVPIRLKNIFGQHQIYPILAAAGVGLIYKMNLVDIFERLTNYQPLAGRLKLIKGIKNSLILDDSYNASPSATLAALEVLGKTSGRKIAVLGDMLELGFHSERAHRLVGAKAAKNADILLAVGDRSIFMYEEARKNGMAKESVQHFTNSVETGKYLQEIIRSGDIILIKGSQSMRMEKVVKEIMAEPQLAKELLVRQDEQWLIK